MYKKCTFILASTIIKRDLDFVSVKKKRECPVYKCVRMCEKYKMNKHGCPTCQCGECATALALLQFFYERQLKYILLTLKAETFAGRNFPESPRSRNFENLNFANFVL